MLTLGTRLIYSCRRLSEKVKKTETCNFILVFYRNVFDETIFCITDLPTPSPFSLTPSYIFSPFFLYPCCCIISMNYLYFCTLCNFFFSMYRKYSCIFFNPVSLPPPAPAPKSPGVIFPFLYVFLEAISTLMPSMGVREFYCASY